jgi:hypothetical protein
VGELGIAVSAGVGNEIFVLKMGEGLDRWGGTSIILTHRTKVWPRPDGSAGGSGATPVYL